MKRLCLALSLTALFSFLPSLLTAGSAVRTTEDLRLISNQISLSCAQYCRTVCIANGETCCFISSTTCGCC